MLASEVFDVPCRQTRKAHVCYYVSVDFLILVCLKVSNFLKQEQKLTLFYQYVITVLFLHILSVFMFCKGRKKMRKDRDGFDFFIHFLVHFLLLKQT